jgi:subtilase family serine protease
VLSSGDSGVGNDETCSQFRPGFPATVGIYIKYMLNFYFNTSTQCPYITAVGGTSLKSPEVGAVCNEVYCLLYGLYHANTLIRDIF